MTFLFPPAPVPTLPVQGSSILFPVRRIWCVGRNYLDHVKELGNDTREPPFFFSKQPDMLVACGGTVAYPSLTQNLHYEGELVVALKEGGENIPAGDTTRLIFGHACGIDLTRRDLQKKMQEKGKPWEIGKSFEQSAPVGMLTHADGPMTSGTIRLIVNGVEKQCSDLNKMIWNVQEIIAKLSQQVRLAAGDLIFTGTPEGVGAVVAGDRMRVEIDGLTPLDVAIGA